MHACGLFFFFLQIYYVGVPLLVPGPNLTFAMMYCPYLHLHASQATSSNFFYTTGSAVWSSGDLWSKELSYLLPLLLTDTKLHAGAMPFDRSQVNGRLLLPT